MENKSDINKSISVDNKISVVINTYNAEAQLRETLESVKEFDEIVVCDMESTDSTREIAAEYGARIVTFEKKNYNIVEVARDFAIHSARYDWVLVVDADERVTPGLKKYLYDHISRKDASEALSIPFASMFMGRFVKNLTERHVRFFLHKKAYWPTTIHSRVQIEGVTVKIPARRDICIEHFDDPTMAQRVTKMNRYTDNETEKRLGRRYSALSLLFRPWLFFLKTLLLKGSIRDGKIGIIRAYMEMNYQTVMLGKHLERTEKTE